MSYGPKAKSVLPSYLTNGSSPLQNPVESRDKKEREALFESIRSSNARKRLSIDLNMPDGVQQRNELHPDNLVEPARDPRDEASPRGSANTSRPASPYTLNPTIDFDGLSWPSKQVNFNKFVTTNNPCRSRNPSAVRINPSRGQRKGRTIEWSCQSHTRMYGRRP